MSDITAKAGLQRLLIAVGLLVAMSFFNQVSGQQQLTEEQIQLIKALTPEQQQKVLRALSKGQGSYSPYPMMTQPQVISPRSGKTGQQGMHLRLPTRSEVQAGQSRHPGIFSPREAPPFNAASSAENADQPNAVLSYRKLLPVYPSAQENEQTRYPINPLAEDLEEETKEDDSELDFDETPIKSPIPIPGVTPPSPVTLVLPGLTPRFDGLGIVDPNLPLLDDAGQLTAAGASIMIQAEDQSVAYPLLSMQNLTRQVEKKLLPFGYDLFAGEPSTFAPATEIPIPADYVVGPGDVVLIQLYGKENMTHELTVGRDGLVRFPAIGPLPVVGLSFDKMQQYLQNTIAQQIIGVKASITLGELRSMRVFVLGEAYRPGTYTVSSLSTLTNALFVSGGVTEAGSLRHIQLKRQGKVISELDLYQLLLQGDTSGDMRLQPSDVIFIPLIGRTAAVAGAVRRPGIYELNGEKVTEELVQLAGGLLPTAFASGARIERINARGDKTYINVDLTKAVGRGIGLHNGDILHLGSALDEMEQVVFLSGHVQRPGLSSWHKGLRVSDLISSTYALKNGADMHYALLKREMPSSGLISTLKVDLGVILDAPGSEADHLLESRDELIVFARQPGRTLQLLPLNHALKLQASLAQPESLVRVWGNIRYPGVYPLHQYMDVQDLIHAGAELLPNTDANYVLIVRRTASGGLQTIALNLLQQPSVASFALQAMDEVWFFDNTLDRALLLEPLIVRLQAQAMRNDMQMVAQISGDVRFPGSYPLQQDINIQELISAAGGLKETAFGREAEVTRFSVNANNERTVAVLVVDLQSPGTDGLSMPIHSYDQLQIKRTPFWSEHASIELSGEIRFPGTYTITKGETLKSVLKRAGGMTEFAYVQGAIFLRKELKKKESLQLQRLKKSLEEDLQTLQLAALSGDIQDQQTLVAGEALLAQAEHVEATGRLVINLPQQLSTENIRTSLMLKDGDALLVPTISQEVSVLGEVQYASSHLFEADLSVLNFIERSGGFTFNADQKRVYVVKADGSVMSRGQNRWFRRGLGALSPGDTIVVPIDLKPRTKAIEMWRTIFGVISQLSISAAALNNISNN